MRHFCGDAWTGFVCFAFLYKEVLGVDLPCLDGLYRPKKSARLPVVLTVSEVEWLFTHLSGIHLLMAKMLGCV